MQGMFYHCDSLNTLNLNSFDFSKTGVNYTNLFDYVSSTVKIIVNNCSDFNNKFSSYNFTNVHLANDTSCSA